jgi:transcription-repair coupling factor (superfamily II helicase)
VEADDARLEAYRRLAGVTTLDELGDLRDEWLDRYGALPSPAIGLLELSELRLACLEIGVRNVAVLPARVGVRSRPVVRMGPLELTLSQQMRVRRTLGSRAYDEDSKELRVEVANADATPHALLTLLRSLVDVAEGANV